MTRLAFILIFLLSGITGYAQSIEKRYTTHLGQDGMTYFFRPKKLGVVNNMDNFTFDVTYLAHADSVTVNCSLAVPESAMVSGMSLKSGGKEYPGGAVAIIFRDITSHGYLLRVTSRFSFDDFKTCFTSTSAVVFSLTFQDGKSSTATYTPGKWKKERSDMSKIINSINF